MDYDLVLAGGGAKGIVHCGALRALEARGHGHRRLVGVSAGARRRSASQGGPFCDASPVMFDEF
jgi:predicted patatin/cPLA2 family phospholipase